MPSVLGTNLLADVAGLITDFFEKLAGPDGTEWLNALKKFLRKEPCWVAKSILRLISGGEKIVIRATDGKRTIAQAKDVFTWGIDGNFTNWGLDVPGEAKPETPVEVHEMIENGNFKAIYESLNRNLDSLRFSQGQIIAFVEDNKNWLRKEGYGTFFLFTKKDEPINKDKSNLFVALVFLDSGEGPVADADHFLRGYEWYGGRRRRLVVPQQTLTA